MGRSGAGTGPWVAAVGLAVGIALQLQQPGPWEPRALVALAAATVGVCGLAAALRVRGASVAAGAGLIAGLVFVGSAGAGFAWTAWRAAERLTERLAPALEGADLELTGIVAELPRTTLTGSRFVFEVESATLHGRPLAVSGAVAGAVSGAAAGAGPAEVPRRVSLAWFRGPDADALLLGPADALRAGQRWRLPVRLKQPHGLVNPHGFDLELYLFERGIRATGSVRSRAEAQAIKLDEDSGAAPIERLRQAVRESIEARVADPRLAGVLAALAVGDQAAIERVDWDLFRLTGVAHLMSISGLHVTMFAWLAGGAIGWAWRRSPRAALAWPAPIAARWGGLVAALAYALVAGWGVPAQRTVLMIAVVVLLKTLGANWPWIGTLLVAGGAVLVADPWALLQPGFWLSFAAVALLVAAEPARLAQPLADAGSGAGAAPAPWRDRAAGVLRGALRTQVVATIGLAPLSLVFFQQVSLVGFVANLIAIPLVTLVITPLALLGVLVAPAWSLGAAVTAGLVGVLQALGPDGAGALAVWDAAAAPAWAVAAGLLGGALLVMPLPWRLRWLGLPLMLPLLAPPVERPGEGQFELVAADVGQGTAVLVRTREHLLVYDAGPAWSAEADAGSRVLVPLLRARGERRIHVLMLSHRDADHVGGAGALLAARPVGELRSSLTDDHPLVADAARRGVARVRCAAGQSWVWDGVAFEVLHPAGDAPLATARANTVSCVLRVVAADGRSALLTGDIEAAQEAALLARHADDPARLEADLLLVPHHGSRTSSSAGFIATVGAEVAVVQAAYRSRFGHPAPDVVERYASQGIALVRSDRCGAFTWRSTAGEPSRCERGAARRYWHHPDGQAAEPATRPGTPMRPAGTPG